MLFMHAVSENTDMHRQHWKTMYHIVQYCRLYIISCPNPLKKVDMYIPISLRRMEVGIFSKEMGMPNSILLIAMVIPTSTLLGEMRMPTATFLKELGCDSIVCDSVLYIILYSRI